MPYSLPALRTVLVCSRHSMNAYEMKHQTDPMVTVWLYMGFLQCPCKPEIKGEHQMSGWPAYFPRAWVRTCKVKFQLKLISRKTERTGGGVGCNQTLTVSSAQLSKNLLPALPKAWALIFFFNTILFIYSFIIYHSNGFYLSNFVNLLVNRQKFH